LERSPCSCHQCEGNLQICYLKLTMKPLWHQLLDVYSLTKTSPPNQLSGNNFSLSFLLDCFAIFKYMVTVDYECLSTLCMVVYLLDLWLPHFPSILHLAILFHILEIVIKIYGVHMSMTSLFFLLAFR
jgi:hypothetical protein